ncbi:hypothetical protein ACFL0L_04505 [Patescibacteria group bacterium]
MSNIIGSVIAFITSAVSIFVGVLFQNFWLGVAVFEFFMAIIGFFFFRCAMEWHRTDVKRILEGVAKAYRDDANGYPTRPTLLALLGGSFPQSEGLTKAEDPWKYDPNTGKVTYVG